MLCNNSINNSSLACKGRARKASKIRKSGKFSDHKCSVYRCTFVPSQCSPVNANQGGSNGPAYEMRKKRQMKREERESKGGKNGGLNRKKKKKKKKKSKSKKHLHAHTFSHRDPCAMTFRECKILAVLDCKE